MAGWWAYLLVRQNDNNVIVIMFLLTVGAYGGGKVVIPGMVLDMVSGEGDGGFTCSWAANDINVIVIVVMLVLWTVGVYEGGWRSQGWFWRW